MTLCSSCLGCLTAGAVTSVGAANENCQEHDRDDHATTDKGRVQKFHAEKLTAFSVPLARHLIRGQRSNQTLGRM